MEYIVVSLAALVVSALTLFSGFGLGTLLMPVFAIFFPLKIAIASTAIVHLANNLLKVSLLGKDADKKAVLCFGIPGIIFALSGAYVLIFLSDLPPVTQYSIGSKMITITPIKMVIAILIFVFSLFDLLPYFEKISFPRKYLSLGGALSGFFGGLSGHQGALRSAFLVKAGLEKEAFIGTGVVCAVLVDFSRLGVYGLSFFAKEFETLSVHGGVKLVATATLAAFLGTFIGTRFIKKMTMSLIRQVVGGMLLLLALALGIGWI
jgi:uncharacterized membrane protein YfcA